MIANAQNKSLIISFGLGKTEIEKNVGELVNVYIQGVFNENEFTIDKKDIFRPITMNNGQISFLADESKEIQIEMIKNDLSKIKSNIIKLIVN